MDMNNHTTKNKSVAEEDFLVGSIFIRSDLRKHIHIFYRFARMSDDIVDNPLFTPDEKIRRLDHVVEVLDGKQEDEDLLHLPCAKVWLKQE